MNKTGAITALMLTRGVGRRTLGSLLERIPSEQLIDVVCQMKPLVYDFGMSPTIVHDMEKALEDAERIQSMLDDMGVVTITSQDTEYPQRLREVLGRDAPPVLFLLGNLDLAMQRAVCFCGARRASEKGLRIAALAADSLTSNGVVVVSGYASGVDLTVHRSALEAGGGTVFVLAEGICHFRLKRDVRELITDENFLVVSEFPPGLPWQGRSAMQRNRTIIGLTDAMVVIESGTTGGTRACAESTMRFGQPLFVADYVAPATSAEGNRYFLERGAIPLRGNDQGFPNMSRILKAVLHSQKRHRFAQNTPSLFPDYREEE